LAGIFRAVKLSTYGPRSFAVAGPTTWNSLPEYLRDPELSIDTFRGQLKTFLFAQYWRRHSSALETFVPSRSINLLFTLHYNTIAGQRGCRGDDFTWPPVTQHV